MSDEYLTKAIFAKNLIRYMEIRNLNSSDLARSLKVSKQSVSFWINAEKMPRMDKIEKLCQILGCNKSDLLEDKKQQNVSAQSQRASVEAVKFALFGGDTEVTDEMYEEVLRFAEYLKSRKSNNE